MAKHQAFSEHFPKLPPQNCIQSEKQEALGPGNSFLETSASRSGPGKEVLREAPRGRDLTSDSPRCP